MVALAQTPDTLVTTYLEMTRPQFMPSFVPADDVRVEPLKAADVFFYRFLYRSVGEKWRWRDRLLLSDEALSQELSKNNTRVYVLYVSGAPAGYIELEQQGDSVEVVYFGLREEYTGRGFGKHLLSYGVQKAWELGAQRVWLHTCNLDSPHALSNYRKRGFRVFKEEYEPMPQRYA